MTDTNHELIKEAAAKLATAKKVVALTGAGVSKESGVPTFRDAREGLWAKYDPTVLATPEGFRQNPKLVWDWYTYRRELVTKTQPNPGHYALAELEQLLPKLILVTQNIDNHHQTAGNQDIIPLHGNLFAFKCAGNCKGHPTVINYEALTIQEGHVPLCPHCKDHYARPDVVWFGEALPEGNLARARREAKSCDVVMVVGTTAMVYPAGWIPIEAMMNGAYSIEVNPDASAVTERIDAYLKGPSGEILPKLVEAVKTKISSK